MVFGHPSNLQDGTDPTRILINLGAGDGAVDVSLAMNLWTEKNGEIVRSSQEKLKLYGVYNIYIYNYIHLYIMHIYIYIIYMYIFMFIYKYVVIFVYVFIYVFYVYK